MSSLIKSVTVFANGFGQFTSRVEFSRSMSESDPRSEFNLGEHWSNIRSRARTGMVNAIAEREQHTTETLPQARGRVRKSLGRLAVSEQKVDSENRFLGVSFQESFWTLASSNPLHTVHG